MQQRRQRAWNEERGAKRPLGLPRQLPCPPSSVSRFREAEADSGLAGIPLGLSRLAGIDVAPRNAPLGGDGMTADACPAPHCDAEKSAETDGLFASERSWPVRVENHTEL
ncbi:hypothetical protein HOK021_37940 [Streptomyces hygroscopicus]|nr:hypothetical protein HOK021_37940 [Streptomyces hygroscopicus]